MDATATIQFANLAADVYRCISALDHGNLSQYKDSLQSGYQTLAALRATDRYAYEEGLLVLRGLAHAKARGTVENFKKNIKVLLVGSRLTPTH